MIVVTICISHWLKYRNSYTYTLTYFVTKVTGCKRVRDNFRTCIQGRNGNTVFVRFSDMVYISKMLSNSSFPTAQQLITNSEKLTAAYLQQSHY